MSKFVIPRPILTSHVVDPSVPEWHTGPQSAPHEHVIREDAPVEAKDRLAVHIGAWHRPADERDHGGERG